MHFILQAQEEVYRLGQACLWHLLYNKQVDARLGWTIDVGMQYHFSSVYSEMVDPSSGIHVSKCITQ